MSSFYPSIDSSLDEVRYMREVAQRSDNEACEVACYSVLWFIGTGREFTGLQRVLSHMTKRTLRAYMARVQREMARNAAKRGAEHIVTGDLDNGALARAMGCVGWEDATEKAVNHPYGKAFTLNH